MSIFLILLALFSSMCLIALAQQGIPRLPKAVKEVRDDR